MAVCTDLLIRDLAAFISTSCSHLDSPLQTNIILIQEENGKVEKLNMFHVDDNLFLVRIIPSKVKTKFTQFCKAIYFHFEHFELNVAPTCKTL